MSLHSTKSLIFAVLEKFSILQFPKMGKKMRERERERERERGIYDERIFIPIF
jgi:uncharacterized membrane protein